MTFRTLLRSTLLLASCSLFAAALPASADSSHARIIRLSMVQGDVRFARSFHGDPLTDSNAGWESAQLNLPIAQGYVLSTDNGRAAVEFENGAMAFLNANTVLEFYDLSLEDGARTTRLILRQGSASFYVNPSGGDYFSVTGSDFTAEATSRTTFRVNNFDDGSNVFVQTGRISVLHKKDSSPLSKGQSLSMKAGDDTSVSLGGLPGGDDFDKWVSHNVETTTAATNASLQYSNSSTYVPGFASLYTYGAWSQCGGSGYGWRPFGAGAAWSPFSGGSWFMDPTFGWSYLSSAAWGWAPYHYGGWLFDNSCGGWFYSPGAYGYGYPYNGYPGVPGKHFPPRVNPPHPLYHGATAVFVRQNGKLGIVPMHPLDEKGKTPLNIEHGLLSASSAKGLNAPLTSLDRGQKFDTLKSAPREAFTATATGLAAAAPPARVSRTLVQGPAGVQSASLGKNSSIAYDPLEHRFVNANAPASSTGKSSEPRTANGQPVGVNQRNGSSTAPVAVVAARVPSAPNAARSSAPPARSMPSPPPARSSGGGFSGSSSGSGRASSGSGSSSAGSFGASAGSSSRGSSGSSASSGSSGGRAH